MFQGFDALPESLRPVARPPRVVRHHTHPHPMPAEPLVDCGVYVEGQRRPGTYTYASALSAVREIQAAGQAAFVWIGLHEPDETHMQTVADVFGLHPLTVED
ncbi:MAG TPA: magnesium transporter CorA, partial [Mycobacterium sp.]|nr:magnesium transporter CorA [Mycobacterium sp.]